MLNVPNIRKTIDWIIQNPQHFNMDQFRCGTTMCIGGFAATLHPDFEPNEDLGELGHMNFWRIAFFMASSILRDIQSGVRAC